jgi:hypothetical protein
MDKKLLMGLKSNSCSTGCAAGLVFFGAGFFTAVGFLVDALILATGFFTGAFLVAGLAAGFLVAIYSP